MGIHDRDWYRDAILKREARAERKAHKNTTQPSKQEPRKPQAHWTIMLMVWVAMLIVGTAIARLLR